MADRGFRKRIKARRADGASFSIKVLPEAAHRGVLSSVYRGRTKSDGPVALKIVRRTKDDRIACELFERELRVVRKAQHQHILPLLGWVKLNDLFVIVTPWQPNGNLFRYLVHHPFANRQMLLFQIADAVTYLHTDAGLVHGDLKCENVLGSADGKALLTDFGLSTFIEKLASDATTRTDIREWHTLRFLAPELLFGDSLAGSGRVRSKTPASDVYAFGMLMLQTFSGQKPWPTHSGLRVLTLLSQSTTHPRPDPPGPSGLTDTLWDVCLACWAFNPARRPAIKQIRSILAVRTVQVCTTRPTTTSWSPEGPRAHAQTSSQTPLIHVLGYSLVA